MELGLSLQLQSYKPISFVENTGTDLGFCMAVGKDEASSDPPLHLHLLPSNNFPFTTCLTQNSLLCEEGPTHSSPSSTVSSFQMEFRNLDEITAETRVLCRGNDAENYGSATATKKLRLSKQQSAFLEETFKKHTTLNPIEKVALAKRLNLRPRQVEVWFQNRRARSKLKQTEVDCEYLNKYCKTLREENKRLQKEIQELRALNASNPFYMQLPATTLTMCPSCQRLPTADADANSGAGVTNNS